jgi:HKD family nuclease
MKIEVIPQIQLGSVNRIRVGDVLNSTIGSTVYTRFRFAVAYMRLSGWDRLASAIDSLVNRGGKISGAIGVDQEITSLEALEALRKVSSNSAVFYTVSGFIYHPKLYLIDNDKQAVAIIGSPNLTRDGLFRNVELAMSVHLDLAESADLAVYKRYDAFINELLDTSHPNVQPITDATLKTLADSGVIKPEAQSREPGPSVRSRQTANKPPASTDLTLLFPPLQVPVAPPSGKVIIQPSPQPSPIVTPPPTVGTAGTFIMQLSAFDASHRSGIPGTPEVLIPHAAVGFFPQLSLSGRKYPDALFDVVLNTPTGRERHNYRLWYYETRATGTKIDEYRLRLGHDTIDLSSPGGGDLLVIGKLPPGSNPAYEVTVLPQSDPTFPAFLTLCQYTAQGKKWGMV